MEGWPGFGVARASGVLLHPTSLPGPYGNGEAGAQAQELTGWLARARQSVWQVLPLNPPGFGDSPYAALSAFAGDPALVDLDALGRAGWLRREELQAAVQAPGTARQRLNAVRQDLLGLAADRLRARPSSARDALDEFCGEAAGWLDDYALFLALHERHEGAQWTRWERGLALREPAALSEARRTLARDVDRHRFAQWRFREDWRAIKQAANAAGVKILGDIPMFVAHQSADVWAHRELFHLGPDGQPTVVAGVPPDYFSATGQRWGNPLYRWDAMAGDGYGWWAARFRAVLETVDLVRIDHFRGFAAHWEIAAHEPTAVNGKWQPGPGKAFFEAMRQQLGTLPIVAEDLGLITPDVYALRDAFELPGMSVLQFAFGGGWDNPYLPHNYRRHTVTYTGTHDNDTTRGWFESRDADERARVLRYLGTDGHDVVWDLMRLASGSVADLCVFPVQDVLGLGSEARMNLPGAAEGNWSWRLAEGQLRAEAADRLAETTVTYAREPGAKRPEYA